ncbi:MAG: hypothetical protein MRY32_03140 [Rickettsiales bacterium]|nr:hypothetical protein [Rickettsiales bacterium]
MLFPRSPEPEPVALSVEIVPIKEFTNLQKSTKPLGKKKSSKLKNQKPVPKTKKEASKPEPKPDTVPMPEPPKEDKIAKPEKKKPKPEEPKPTPKKVATTPDKPKPKKEKKKPKKEEDDFAALLSKLEQETVSEDDAPEDDKADDSNTSQSDEYNSTIPLSMSEKDAIRNQFKRCWRLPAGAAGDYELAVRVRVLFNADGTAREVGLVRDQVSRYQSDSFFRAAADSAIRAVQLCSPLKDMPMEKYDSWKDIEFNFDPMEMLY